MLRMLRKILKRETKMERKIEINPYSTDIEARRDNHAGIADTVMSFVPFCKKKKQIPTNPFLTRKPELPNIETVQPDQLPPPQKTRGWIWYIPVVIFEQLEWIKFHTTEGKRILAKRKENADRYQNFLELCGKKD